MHWWLIVRDIHPSWLIAGLSLGIVCGVIAAPSIEASWFYSVVWLIAGLGFAAVCFWQHKLYCLFLILLAGGVIGLWRSSLSQVALSPYAQLIGYQVHLAGTVSEDADLGKNNELLLRLKDIQLNDHPVSGNIWVSLARNVDIKRGDRVELAGRLSDGFGSFAASVYRANLTKVQRPSPGDIGRRARDAFADQVREAIPEPEVSLGLGYLVGQRRALPAQLSEALQIAGLTHVIVASGYNLTILVRFARRLLVKVSKYLATVSAAVMILSFILVTGMSPSMSRAGLVAGLSLAAWYYGRKFHPLVLLPFAAAVTLMINPSYGWNDLGWQLSFAAFAGVMVVAPLAQAYFFGNKKPGTLRQIAGETITAQVATLPILVLAFSQFSNVAVVANLLILPLVPLAMLFVFLTGLAVIFFAPLAVLLGAATTALLHYMTTVAQFLAGLPWALTKIQISGWIVVLYYAVLIGLCLYVWRTTKYNLRDSNIVE